MVGILLINSHKYKNDVTSYEHTSVYNLGLHGLSGFISSISNMLYF